MDAFSEQWPEETVFAVCVAAAKVVLGTARSFGGACGGIEVICGYFLR